MWVFLFFSNITVSLTAAQSLNEKCTLNLKL
uniref:Uncharacterized protein n=1 Tax=Anguilla anguilla TaxID=7936 RepID=A0A0E9WF92_ANGAN